MITSARKLKYTLPDGTEVVSSIIIVRDGQTWTVPMNESNADYAEILKQVASGDLTIADAD